MRGSGGTWEYSIPGRLSDLLTGHYYDLSILTGGESSTPFWYDISFGVLLSFSPFIALGALAYLLYCDLNKRTINSLMLDDRSYFHIVSRGIAFTGMALFCAILVFGPDQIGKISMLRMRLFPALAPLVAAILTTSIKARKATIISLGVPILISAYLFLIMPLYIRSQLLLSEQSLLTENLIISVDGFRDRVNFRDGPVFIRYTPAIINGNWFHTRILPFLMSADQRLSSNKIYIINE